MGISVQFNFIEAVFWIVLAVAFAILALVAKQDFTKLYLLTCIFLFLFGCSDFVEMRSGAWWRPWWLLIWKAACVAAFLALYLWHRRIKTRLNRTK